MEYSNILYTKKDQVVTITINRPKQLNALNKKTIEELSDCLTKVEKDTEARVIILTGSGDKAFIAGADIKEFANFSVEQGKNLSSKGHATLFDLVENLNTPVIAAINGFALGGGLELAMSAHIRIASDNAKLGLPEVSLGVIPGYGGTQRLSQLTGKGKAMELILTAGMISAEEAYRIKLVNNVVTQENLIETCLKIAKKILRNSPMALKSSIISINAGYKDGVNGFNTEIEQFGECFGTEDFKEGTNAFLEKRPASFSGN